MQHDIPSSSAVTCKQGDPLTCYRQWRAGVPAGYDGLLLVDFTLQQYWLADTDAVALTALYCVRAGDLHVAVTDQRLIADGCSAADQFDRWVAQHRLVSTAAGMHLELLPEYIPKPWGREIWYSGVEQRGVCCFGPPGSHTPDDRPPDGRPPHARTPIPWLQAVLPDVAAGPAGKALVLLKILDPAPQPVTGDLYFELHEQKREVYVVTHVDERAWPDGVGYIRFGFAPQQIARSSSEAAFRVNYLEVVQAYEEVRRTLDELAGGAMPTAAQLLQEQQLRDDMNSFTHLRSLQVGDVVVVPLLLPHSLQHGVRTIEFQTPVYERKILSFTQKVLTQDHWDTSDALQRMRLTPPEPEPFECLLCDGEVLVERIVDFPDFEVRRLRIPADASLALEPMRDYGLVMVVEGQLMLDGCCYQAEQAVLLPRAYQARLIPVDPAQPLVLLLALPRS